MMNIAQVAEGRRSEEVGSSRNFGGEEKHGDNLVFSGTKRRAEEELRSNGQDGESSADHAGDIMDYFQTNIDLTSHFETWSESNSILPPRGPEIPEVDKDARIAELYKTSMASMSKLLEKQSHRLLTLDKIDMTTSLGLEYNRIKVSVQVDSFVSQELYSELDLVIKEKCASFYQQALQTLRDFVCRDVRDLSEKLKMLKEFYPDAVKEIMGNYNPIALRRSVMKFGNDAKLLQDRIIQRTKVGRETLFRRLKEKSEVLKQRAETARSDNTAMASDAEEGGMFSQSSTGSATNSVLTSDSEKRKKRTKWKNRRRNKAAAQAFTASFEDTNDIGASSGGGSVDVGIPPRGAAVAGGQRPLETQSNERHIGEAGLLAQLLNQMTVMSQRIDSLSNGSTMGNCGGRHGGRMSRPPRHAARELPSQSNRRPFGGSTPPNRR